jgi:hypothetical protein
MKVDISRFVLAAVIAVLLVVGGSTAAWAQCPTSPNYVSNFNSDQACLKQNGTSAFFTPEGGPTILRLTQDLQGQAGSAWFSAAQQVVKGGFSTTFQFQFTRGAHSPADGIAFVIQNSSQNALGQGGGSIGYADAGGTCPAPGAEGGTVPCDIGGGIPDSLAIEFDTYDNGFATGDPDANHIAVQSCGVGLPNSPAHSSPNGDNFPSCIIGSLASPSPIIMSDGHPHTVVISYTPPPSCTECKGTLTVNLDDHIVLTVAVTLENEINLSTGGKAWVGFTSATGAAFENHDILSWTFAPQAQSGVATTDTPAVLNFNGGALAQGATGYDYNAKLLSGGLQSATVQVQPILISEENCEKLVDANPAFGHAQCFVFQNADGKGTRSSVLYELTCPDLPNTSCDESDFIADLGTDFVFQKADNRGFQFLNSTIGPYAGWLKGNGGVLGHPCAIDPNTPPPFLFQSNQISSFTVTGDPTGITKGKGVPGGSCWVATYGTSGEAPPGVKVAIPTFTSYKQNTVVKANYKCSNPKTTKDPATSPVGPYLTVASCTQNQAPNPNNLTQNPGCVLGSACSGGVDTSVRGLHVFTVTSKDSGGNVGANVIIYNVTK